MDGGFKDALYKYFDTDTVNAVRDTLVRLDLPEPEDDFLSGTEGILIFMERYGTVLRIEHANTEDMSLKASQRINHAYILQPLISHNIGKATIEICPGTDIINDYKIVKKLSHKLKKSNIRYWDDQISNTGLIPIKTICFPKGIPVVIDRLAVNKLSGYGSIRDVLAEHHAEKITKFYKPLKDAFQKALAKNGLPDKTKINQAWQLCEKFKEQGKLIAGWKNADDRDSKIKTVKLVAEEYEQKLNKYLSRRYC